MFDDGRVRNGRIGTSDLFGNLRMQLGQPLHMGFVDDRIVVSDLGRTVTFPIIGTVNHY